MTNETRPDVNGARQVVSNVKDSTDQYINSDVLKPHHAQMIRDSAISDDVARERGYWTATSAAQVKRLNISAKRENLPALMLPVHGVDRKIVFHQARHDQPREKHGKVNKYETPYRARMAVDVPPRCHTDLDNPKKPLFITEGIRKGDALASLGVCAVDLIGVWNFRNKNENGGKALMSDFDSIAFNDRTVYIVYDSDAVTKKQVQQACERLAGVARNRGADVHYIVLPPMTDGNKQGVDDFLAEGHGISDLLSLARRDLPHVQGEDADQKAYFERDGGLFWRKKVGDGEDEVSLTNFTARIAADVVEDDGSDQKRTFQIEGSVGHKPYTIDIPVQQFTAMNWPIEHLGASAIMYPGYNVKVHTQVAIQSLSGDIRSRRIYAHTGWRDIDGSRCYLHAGGAIGAEGRVSDVEVNLPGVMDRYRLPEPVAGQELSHAVRASLEMTAVAPAHIVYLILAATYSAPVGPISESLHIVGPTGAGKSQITALAQQHFGAELDAEHLPGSWDSTANALEDLAFRGKDALFVIDDFAPNQSGTDAKRMHKDSDRVFRAKANGSGRSRMRADTSLRMARPPKAMLMSTGEDHLNGASLRARVLTLELGPDDIHWECLSRYQVLAAGGAYASAMASFIQWLAATYPESVGRPDIWHVTQRDETAQMAAAANLHKRTPRALCELGASFRLYLDFAVDVGAITVEEADQHWQQALLALETVAAVQTTSQAAAEPTQQFADLLSSALTSGRAHVANRDGGLPESPQSWGWQSQQIGNGAIALGDWRPCGERVGCIDGDDLYLDPETSIGVVRRMAGDGAGSFSLGREAFGKRLYEQGHLVTTDTKREVLTVRRVIASRRINVWHLSTSFVNAPVAESVLPTQSTVPGANSDDQFDHQPAHQDHDVHGENGSDGRDGRVAGTEDLPRAGQPSDAGVSIDGVCLNCRNPVARWLAESTGGFCKRCARDAGVEHND